MLSSPPLIYGTIFHASFHPLHSRSQSLNPPIKRVEIPMICPISCHQTCIVLCRLWLSLHFFRPLSLTSFSAIPPYSLPLLSFLGTRFCLSVCAFSFLSFYLPFSAVAMHAWPFGLFYVACSSYVMTLILHILPLFFCLISPSVSYFSWVSFSFLAAESTTPYLLPSLLLNIFTVIIRRA